MDDQSTIDSCLPWMDGWMDGYMHVHMDRSMVLYIHILLYIYIIIIWTDPWLGGPHVKDEATLVCACKDRAALVCV